MKARHPLMRGLLITGAVFAALIGGAAALIGGIGSRTGEAERQMVLQSVRSAALTCYAVEGAYPAELDYLRRYYGLMYDENVYTVSYSAFASNLFPDIAVMEGGDGLR